MATTTGAKTRRGGHPHRDLTVPSLELDSLDHALIEKLRNDGRAGNRKLATELNVNEVTVATRLRRLEDAGVMRVVAITDIRLFGHREFAFAMIKVVGRSVHAVAEDLAKLPESIAVTICTGRFDIIIPLLGRNRQHIAELFGTVLPKIKGVYEIHGCMALDVLKYDSKWALFGVDPGSTPEALPSATVDQMDLAIIALLQQNARRSNRQLAVDLDVSEGTVRIRIKRMLAERVFRIQAVSDIMVSGVGAHAYILITATPGKVKDVAKSLARREDVAQITRVLDQFDLVAVLHSADRTTLVDSIMHEIALLPGVHRVETLDGVASLKHSYAWTWIV
ncbi:Lrp/AsnC family transcriptional regulator [Mycobacteroides abscessus]|uniref:Lrp/AsnC family transcriptional regulator n=1 Tax=Mycobacteroides abscessus TaxID=36809 RepID=UPI000D82D065|nr:Lrp/AsnC family transcriptional regulator [Mycobacteroides abscessus]SPX87991.1 AsnC family transcriptional regulator [Mycobacteroides abscessus]